ncbi:Transcription factor bHLH95 [Linum grandiflorum]
MQGGRGVLDSDPSSAVSAITTSEPVTREAFLAAQGPSKLPTTSTNAPLMAAAPSNEFQTWFSPNVVLNMCGDDAHICVCSVKKPGLFPNLLHILQKHNLDVVSAHVSSHHRHSCTYMIHVHAGVGCGSQFPESLSVEDTFKLAAGEMNLWLLSC